jgi:hypothetical protein
LLNRTIQVDDFDGIWTYPARGLADTAIGGITWSPTRNSPALAWSAPYFTVRDQEIEHNKTLSINALNLCHPSWHGIRTQVTRTLVYHRARLPTGLAFPEGVTGVIRGTPGSTGMVWFASMRRATVQSVRSIALLFER